MVFLVRSAVKAMKAVAFVADGGVLACFPDRPSEETALLMSSKQASADWI
jgi:hypothetical protein